VLPELEDVLVLLFWVLVEIRCETLRGGDGVLGGGGGGGSADGD